MMRIAAILPLVFGFLGCSNETKFSEVVPNTGTFAGSEEVELRGNAFPKGGVSVRFGSKEATNVVMMSDHTIKVSTPAGDKGTAADVTMVFDDGRAFVLRNGFRYVDSTQQRATMDNFFKKASGESKTPAPAPTPTTPAPTPTTPAPAPTTTPPPAK
jgi:hypothetical protein